MKGFRSLTTRLSFWILLAGGAVFAVTIWTSNRLARETAIHAAEQEARRAARTAASRVQEVLRSVEETTELLGATVESLDPEPTALTQLLRRFVLGNPNVYGSAAAFEPRAYRPDRERYAPYLFRKSDGDAGLAEADLANARYRYWEKPWYTQPLRTTQPAWSEPYVDEDGGGVVMVTYAVPLLRAAGSGQPFGVVTADVHLDWLSRLVGEVKVGRTGFGVLLSRKGRVLAHPRLKAEGAPLLEQIPEERRAIVAPLVAKMLSGESGFERIEIQGRPHWVTYAPVGAPGWSLAVAYPEDELAEAVYRMRTLQAALAAGGLALLALVIVTLARRLTAPLRELAATARRLAGDLETELPEPRSRDELGALTGAFRDMREALVRHIQELQATTAAKERLESELKIARRIQMDMLPPGDAGGPADGYALAARLVPARAVGGDLYDHFVQEGRVFFLVADVSGKGVGAALFMARTKTLFEAIAARERDPSAILCELNRGLCRENDAGMFVTGICGLLDPSSGELAFASAGHDPPIHVRADGPPEPFTVVGGTVLGLIDEAEYPVNRLQLLPGEALVGFTDGVTEALSTPGEMFGEQRLIATLAAARRASAAGLAEATLAAVRAFAGEAPQSDDITVLALVQRPPAQG
jgi:sigma-B regulation protein RsbU (phosphoserine phosphatase)